MAEIEKVIKALKCRAKAENRCSNPCERIGMCEYAKLIVGNDGEPYYPYICDKKRICEDALELLKEQEPITIKTVMINGNGKNGRCPHCITLLNEWDYPKYCGFCGQAVKWE